MLSAKCPESVLSDRPHIAVVWYAGKAFNRFKRFDALQNNRQNM